ncbi:phosphoribosyl-AMP cyclohydrolase [uncultured Mobiluncus sp.]|uniref:phosphoribosyl-AMP cyclohydrolase n=1 Tax=uncultured Mobiluncus sp. TaxID=293425 RepID=UPI002614FC7C|nr:phosphoribosyl-AMP cyclohydrolase [uncultured Mobiluncus sp.]
MTELPNDVSRRLKRDAQGLFAAVIQDFDTKRVLMVGYMNDEALARTLHEGRVTFWSRSREEYWRKGDTSGHFQFLRRIEIDCDGDALLLQVKQIGAACHTGTLSCFDAGGVIESARVDADMATPAPLCGTADRPTETAGR